MATIKSYTDLTQSKKLAEILPLESADMCYPYDRYLNKMYGDIPYVMGYKKFNKDIDIPCWSLAALLDILPLEIETHKQTDGYKTYYYVESYMKRMGKETYLSTERHENLVDACVEMIFTLNERNLL